jgi:hypothetical protein
MNHLQRSIPSQHYTISNDAGQPAQAVNSQTPNPHPPELTLAMLSLGAHIALERIEAQPNAHHQLMALLVRNGIDEGNMRVVFAQGADAHYEEQLHVLPENDAARLTLRVILNQQAQYDVAGIDLYVPSSDRRDHITFAASPATAQH